MLIDLINVHYLRVWASNENYLTRKFDRRKILLTKISRSMVLHVVGTVIYMKINSRRLMACVERGTNGSKINLAIFSYRIFYVYVSQLERHFSDH